MSLLVQLVEPLL